MANSTPNAGSHHLDSRAPDLMTEGTGDPNDLLNTSDVAEWLGISTQFLEIGRHRGFGPPYIRVSPRRIRYRRGDVLNWLAARKHHRTSEYA
jgi:predicted DNA-binding transcriptional regulator AlpA